jgi:hypothetical protein
LGGELGVVECRGQTQLIVLLWHVNRVGVRSFGLFWGGLRWEMGVGSDIAPLRVVWEVSWGWWNVEAKRN